MGLVSALIFAPVLVIVIAVSLVLSMLIPVPAVNVFGTISVQWIPINTPSTVIPVGISLGAVKLIVPPCQKQHIVL